MSEIHPIIQKLAQEATAARAKLVTFIEAACPGPHKPVQHRDAWAPWCDACRYTADGELRVAKRNDDGSFSVGP